MKNRATQQPRSLQRCVTCRLLVALSVSLIRAMGYAIYVGLVPLLSGRVPEKKERFILILNVIIVVVLVCVCVYLLSAHDCVT